MVITEACLCEVRLMNLEKQHLFGALYLDLKETIQLIKEYYRFTKRRNFTYPEIHTFKVRYLNKFFS